MDPGNLVLELIDLHQKILVFLLESMIFANFIIDIPLQGGKILTNIKHSPVDKNILVVDLKSTLRTSKRSSFAYQSNTLRTICLLPPAYYFGDSVGSIKNL